MKRKRARERGNATRFITAINGFSETSSLDDYQHYQGRLQDTLDKLLTLDDAIHDLLSDLELILTHIDSAKRALLQAARGTEKRLALSTSALNVVQSVPAASTEVLQPVKQPTIKLEPFAGDIEEWFRFWEQFQSSVDQNPVVSRINKHVFLRGYLEGEPKRLVDGIAVIADTYEETKKFLHLKYGDRSRIIQAHLDFLERLQPVRSATPEFLNHTYVKCISRIQALRALGESIDGYGRVLAPKILRAFPEDRGRGRTFQRAT